MANYDIVTMNADGSGLVNLTSESKTTDYAPTFSPDGARIAYLHLEGDYVDLMVMHADGTQKRNLTDFGQRGKKTKLESSYGNPVYPFSASWSPDGRTIALTTQLESSFDVYAVSPDGHDFRRLTHTPGHDMHVTWGPPRP